jgi:hypothetical protein
MFCRGRTSRRNKKHFPASGFARSDVFSAKNPVWSPIAQTCRALAGHHFALHTKRVATKDRHAKLGKSVMSYLSSADMAVVRQSAPSRDLSVAAMPVSHLRAVSPVGPALEVVLFVASNAAVSLVFCTAVAGALLH